MISVLCRVLRKYVSSSFGDEAVPAVLSGFVPFSFSLVPTTSSFFASFVVPKCPSYLPPPSSRFFFLRFICPTLVSPSPIHLQGEEVGRKERRLLVLVAKVVQNVASLVEFGEKEKFMMYLFYF